MTVSTAGQVQERKRQKGVWKTVEGAICPPSVVSVLKLKLKKGEREGEGGGLSKTIKTGLPFSVHLEAFVTSNPGVNLNKLTNLKVYFLNSSENMQTIIIKRLLVAGLQIVKLLKCFSFKIKVD